MAATPARQEASNMFLRLAAFLREQLDPLVVQYDERLRTVPGYANLPEAARHDLDDTARQADAEANMTADDSVCTRSRGNC
jgi:hypothetical protein